MAAKYETPQKPTDWGRLAQGAWDAKGEIALNVGTQVLGEMAVPPMLRPEILHRAEDEKPYAGTGNNITDFLPWAVDRANDVTSYRLDKLVPDKWKGQAAVQATDNLLAGFAKKSAEKGFLGWAASGIADSRFLPNAGTAANLATGVGVGVGVPLATNLAADYYQNRGNPRQQYMAAMKAGDREEAERIAADINGRARVALGAKTIANGASTGSILGPKGMLIGSGAALPVVGLQNAFPAKEFEAAPDAYWNSPMGRAKSFRFKFGQKYEKADKFSDEDYAGFEDQYAHYLGDDYDPETEKFNMGVVNKIRAFSEAGDASATAAYKRLYERRQNHKD